MLKPITPTGNKVRLCGGLAFARAEASGRCRNFSSLAEGERPALRMACPQLGDSCGVGARSPVWWAIPCAVVLASSTASSMGQRYVEIAARIDLASFRPGDTNTSTSQVQQGFSVVCITGTNEWRIDNDHIAGVASNWLFDGTNVYESVLPNTPPPEETRARFAKSMGLATAPFVVARSNLTVNIYPSSDGNPLGNYWVNIPWLAFCSGSYLKLNDRVVSVPLANLRYSADGFAYSDRTQTFPDELGLPRTMELFASEARLSASVRRKDFLGNHDVGMWKNSMLGFRDGMLKLHYSVSDSTNFLGWNLPLRFELVQYAPDMAGKWGLQHSATGRVTSVRECGRPQTLFTPEIGQSVVDWRFQRTSPRSVNAIVYRSTNRFALATNDPALQRRFAETVRRAPLSREFLRLRLRIVAGVVFLLVTAFPLVVAFQRRRNTRPSKKQKTLSIRT
jgi:hypothetical protein